MFSLNPKTKAEIEGQETLTEMTQAQYNDKYFSGSRDTFWHCDKCMRLFDDGDIIIESVFKSEHKPLCPLESASIKKYWGYLGFRDMNKKCLNRLTCSNMDYWQKNYHLIPLIENGK